MTRFGSPASIALLVTLTLALTKHGYAITTLCNNTADFLPNHETIINCMGLTGTQCTNANNNPVVTEWKPGSSICEFKPTTGAVGQQRTACTNAGGSVDSAVTCSAYPSAYFSSISTIADCDEDNTALMDLFAQSPWGCCGSGASFCSPTSASPASGFLCNNTADFLPSHETIVECSGLTDSQCTNMNNNPVVTEWKSGPSICEFKPTTGALGQQRAACTNAGGTISNVVTCSDYPTNDIFKHVTTKADCTEDVTIYMGVLAAPPWGCCGGGPSFCQSGSGSGGSTSSSNAASLPSGSAMSCMVMALIIGVVVLIFS